jgi:hypothetical protein
MPTYPLTRKHDPTNKEATNPLTLAIDFSTNTDVTIILFSDETMSATTKQNPCYKYLALVFEDGAA